MNQRGKPHSIHTSRTMMFSELSMVMDHAINDDSYLKSLSENIANKRTKTNQDKTTGFLMQLYGFKLDNSAFLAFKYFWQITESDEKPLLTLLFALNRDFLLAESLDVILSTSVGSKVSIEKLEENIESFHTERYTVNTLHSIAQNIASSWKQAGYIKGKVKNVRTKTNPTYKTVTFALLMSYLNGDRGDFVLSGIWVKALDLPEPKVRELISEAAKRDLLNYQFAGGVTTISFENLLNKIGSHGF